MYSNDKTSKGVNRVLTIIFVVVALVIVGFLAKAVIERVDGDTMTLTSESEDNEECGDDAAQQALQNAGVKVPVKCKNNK